MDVWFAGGMDWSQWSSQSFPTGFKADCGGEAINHTAWTYFLMQAGEGAELTGFGAYAGSSLNMVHAPANNYFGFQLGDGANNYNGVDNGFRVGSATAEYSTTILFPVLVTLHSNWIAALIITLFVSGLPLIARVIPTRAFRQSALPDQLDRLTLLS